METVSCKLGIHTCVPCRYLCLKVDRRSRKLLEILMLLHRALLTYSGNVYQLVRSTRDFFFCAWL